MCGLRATWDWLASTFDEYLPVTDEQVIEPILSLIGPISRSSNLRRSSIWRDGLRWRIGFPSQSLDSGILRMVLPWNISLILSMYLTLSIWTREGVPPSFWPSGSSGWHFCRSWRLDLSSRWAFAIALLISSYRLLSSKRGRFIARPRFHRFCNVWASTRTGNRLRILSPDTSSAQALPSSQWRQSFAA